MPMPFPRPFQDLAGAMILPHPRPPEWWPRREGRGARALMPGILLVLTACLLAVVPVPPARAAGTVDPDLAQTLGDDEPVATDAVSIGSGHVDLGPKFVDGNWTVMLRDDAARSDPGATSVWRRPEDTVLRVGDGARLTVPEGDTYDFLGAETGSPVWVVPQTQDQDVVWLGWNTQDPDVVEAVDRGVTMHLDGVQGPGLLTVYLQSGSFTEPEVLWSTVAGTGAEGASGAWVDVNTHTHANWVFTEPGVYLLHLRIEADLVDGSTVEDTALLRFAVGDETSDEDAATASWQDDGVAARDGADAAVDTGAGTTAFLGGARTWILLGGVLAVTVLVFLGAGAARGARARRAVFDTGADVSRAGAAKGSSGAGDAQPGATSEDRPGTGSEDDKETGR